jgi:Holliday junction resolvase RusA-like endonuclease
MRELKFYYKDLKPVSLNQAKTVSRRTGCLIKTDKLRKFQDVVHAEAFYRRRELQDFEQDYNPKAHYLTLEMTVECPNLMTKKNEINRRCLDLDNVQKYTTDAIFKEFNKLDDAYICEITVKKMTSPNKYFNFHYKLAIKQLVGHGARI